MINQKKKNKALRDEIAADVDNLTPEQIADLNTGMDEVEGNTKIVYFMIGGLALGLIVLTILSM